MPTSNFKPAQPSLDLDFDMNQLLGSTTNRRQKTKFSSNSRARFTNTTKKQAKSMECDFLTPMSLGLFSCFRKNE